MAPLLTIDNFSLTFLASEQEDKQAPVLNNINLRIEAGETHALVGESRSGKSVAALSILRLLEDTNRVRSSSSIVLAGHQ